MKPKLNGHVLNEMLVENSREKGGYLLKRLMGDFSLPLDMTSALTPDNLLWTVVRNYFDITWEPLEGD